MIRPTVNELLQNSSLPTEWVAHNTGPEMELGEVGVGWGEAGRKREREGERE